MPDTTPQASKPSPADGHVFMPYVQPVSMGLDPAEATLVGQLCRLISDCASGLIDDLRRSPVPEDEFDAEKERDRITALVGLIGLYADQAAAAAGLSPNLGISARWFLPHEVAKTLDDMARARGIG